MPTGRGNRGDQAGRYDAGSAAAAIKPLLENVKYRENAKRLKRIMDSEHGIATACDAIAGILRK